MTLDGEDSCTSTVVALPGEPGHHSRTGAAEWPGDGPKKVGYSRVQGAEQPVLYEAVQALLSAGVTAGHIHTDRGTRRPSGQREGWQEASADLQSGDILVVPSLAQLARSRAELGRMVAELAVRGVELQVLSSESTVEMRSELLAELQAERDLLIANESDKRRGRHHRNLDLAKELAVIEALDSGGNRRDTAVQQGVSRGNPLPDRRSRGRRLWVIRKRANSR